MYGAPRRSFAEGLPEIYYAKATPSIDPIARIEHAEQFFAAQNATIRHGGNRAHIAQELGYVQMPNLVAFRDAGSYHSTLAHELAHWTKHPSRLARDLGRKSWGDAGYAAEELVAEISNAYVCADLDLQNEPREEDAIYIANWLQVPKSDSRAIFSAPPRTHNAPPTT
jgi:antirestriction protein ArdC